MDRKLERDFSGTRGVLLLWSGWAIGPLAWTIHLWASYLLAPYACATRNFMPLYLLTAAMLLITAAGAYLSWRIWRKFGGEWPGSDAGVPTRSSFMSMVGLLVNALFFVVIVAQGIPVVILRECA